MACRRISVIGRCLAGRYETRAELGQGGMATVYRATDRALHREVAVKVLAAEGLRKDAIRRFQREARLVGRLDHPAVVPIYDFGRDEDQLFFVMPLLEGETLHRLLHDRPPPLIQILEILARVAEALDHSASRGVVHRDIKPENLMIALDGGEGVEAVRRVQVMDYGLALCRTSTRLTKTGILPGTLAYLSPEQILSNPDLDGRSDLYSVGIILYESLFGRPPFGGASPSVLYRIVHETPEFPEADFTDPLLLDVLRTCLEKDPEDRIQTGSELARALRAVGGRIDETDTRPAGHRHRRRRARKSEPPLIGRNQELEKLRRALERAEPGALQLVFVSGDTGSGKTRLLEALEDEARSRHALVLHGSFAEAEGPNKYGAFYELVEDYFLQLDEAVSEASSGGSSNMESDPGRLGSNGSADGDIEPTDRIPPDLSSLAAELSAAFPALAEVPAIREAARGVERPGHSDEPNQHGELIARTLGRMAHGRPCVLVMEQIHQANMEVGFLQYLLRRLSSAPILLVASYRPTEVPRTHPLARSIGGLRADPRFREIHLGPLGVDEHTELVEEVLGAPADPDLIRRIFEATNGSPFFTSELLHALAKSEEPTPGRGDELRVSGATRTADGLPLAGVLPSSVRQAVEAKLERLRERPLLVVEAASILGHHVMERDLEDLVAIAALTENESSELPLELSTEDLEKAVDTLIARGLLEKHPSGRRGRNLRFTNGIVREVVYRQIPAERRRRLHLRRARSLSRRPSGQVRRRALELLHHFAEARVASEALRYGSMQARRFVATCHWDDALSACDLALGFVDEAQVNVEIELRRARATALAAKGLISEAMAEGQQMFDRLSMELQEEESDFEATKESAATMADIALFLAETSWRAQRIEETRSWLELGIGWARLAGEPARETLGSLLSLGGTVRNLAGQSEEGRQLLGEAARLRAETWTDSPEAPGGTLRVAMIRSFTGLDPTDAISAQDAEISQLIFEPLLRASADGALHPCLGPSWECSDDGLTYRFRIDTRRTFSDGTPLTATTVQTSLRQAARLAAGRRPAALDVVAEVAAPNEKELLIRLRDPLAAFPALLSDPRIAVALRYDGDTPPIGTGAFRLAHRSPERLVLTRNDSHPLHPFVDRMEVEFFRHSRDIAAAWRRGELDLARDLSPSDVAEFQRRPGSDRLADTPQNNVYFTLLNPRGPALGDPELRRVLATSVDVTQIVWKTLPRFATPLVGWLPPGISDHHADGRPDTMPHDEALRAMEFLHTLPLRLRAIEHPAFSDQYRPIADALCQAWSRLGIDVDRHQVSIAEFARQMNEPADFDLVFARWWPDYPDPDGFFYGAFHSSAGLFRSLFASGELDTQIEEARFCKDSEERTRRYRHLEQLLLGRHLVQPLFHDVEYRLMSSRVRGLATSPTPPFVNYSRLSLRPRDRPDEVERRDGRLVVALGGHVDTLDPAWCVHVDAAEVVSNIFEPLTRLDETANAVPHLAKHLESDDGGRRWRVTLRKTRFHNGRYLTARDVRYSFRRLLTHGSPDLHCFLDALEGARETAEERGDLTGVQVVGEHLLELILVRPVPHFPALLSNAATAIVPEGTEEFGPTWRHGTAGTGPFRLVDFQPGRRVDLVANGDYRQPALPKVAEMVFELGTEPEQAAEDFASGRLSMVSTLAAEDLEAFSRRPDYAAGLMEQPSFSTYFATLTSVRGPLADPGCRRSLAALLSNIRSELPSTLGRLGRPANRLVPPSLLGLSDPTTDSSHASATAGAERLDGLTLNVALHPGYGAEYRQLWRKIRGALEIVGVRVVPTHADFSETLRSTSLGAIDVVFNRWIADYPDPASFAQAIAHGPTARQWDDLELSHLADRALLESDREARHTLYLEFERRLTEHAYLVPLFHEQSWCLVRPGIDGLRLRYSRPEVSYEELKIRGSAQIEL